MASDFSYNEKDVGESEWNMASATFKEIRYLFNCFNQYMITGDYNMAYRTIWQVVDELSPLITSTEENEITNMCFGIGNKIEIDKKDKRINNEIHYLLSTTSRKLRRIMHRSGSYVPKVQSPEEELETDE